MCLKNYLLLPMRSMHDGSALVTNTSNSPGSIAFIPRGLSIFKKKYQYVTQVMLL